MHATRRAPRYPPSHGRGSRSSVCPFVAGGPTWHVAVSRGRRVPQCMPGQSLAAEDGSLGPLSSAEPDSRVLRSPCQTGEPRGLSVARYPAANLKLKCGARTVTARLPGARPRNRDCGWSTSSLCFLFYPRRADNRTFRPPVTQKQKKHFKFQKKVKNSRNLTHERSGPWSQPQSHALPLPVSN